jgi:hypothetical protein
MAQRLLFAALLSLTACEEQFERDAPPKFSKTSHPQIGVTSGCAFVGGTKPLLTDVGGAYLVRLELTPDGSCGEARAIVDICRSGGSAVVTVTGSSIPPFIVTAVTDRGEALVLCNTRDRAVEILHALRFEDKEFGEQSR